MAEQRGVINAYDVVVALRESGWTGIVVQVSGGFRDIGFKIGNETHARWHQVTEAHPEITEWASPLGRYISGSLWLPVSAIEAAKAVPAVRKVKWGVGHPCERVTHPDQWSSATCGKVATEHRAMSPYGGRGGGDEEPIGICSTHLGAIARSEAHWEQRRKEVQARNEESQARSATTRASAGWASRLADEFGVHAEAAEAVSADHLAVQVRPEHLYAMLSTAAGLLRDVGVEWDQVLAELPRGASS